MLSKTKEEHVGFLSSSKVRERQKMDDLDSIVGESNDSCVLQVLYGS